MKQSELEALVIAQGERLEQMSTALDAARRELTAVHQQMSDKQALIDGLCDTLNGLQSETGRHEESIIAVEARLEKVEAMVYARNASAATKRNMTDDDAKRVLIGDLKDKSHKEAAEIANLTYAQVYSCRGEFTFKHIHKDLRDTGVNGEKWANPWSKK